MSFGALPKIELHLHLEGAAPPDLIRRLGAEKRLSLKDIFGRDGAYKYRDFNEFLNVYERATEALRSPADYNLLTETVLADAAEHGVVYVEVFLSPDFCGAGDLGAWREYLAAIQDAAARAEARYGIVMRGIVTAVRHFGPERAKPVAICAAETAGPFIVGFGMGGDELAGAPKDFAWAFDAAREAELGLTVHAGEWGGAASVRRAIDELGVARIGHGVQAIDDPALVKDLADREVVLEVCPGSNVALGVYPNLEAHPVERLRESGVKLTISTDDPPFFHTTMTAEYDGLAQTFGWDESVFGDIHATALKAAFCDAETKAKVEHRVKGA